MSVTRNFLKPVVLIPVSISLLLLSACGEDAVAPTPEQAAELTKIVGACKKVEGKQSLSHLPEFRKKYGVSFTCEDLERACSTDYPGNECASARVEIAVETAFEKACRRNAAASGSAACSKLLKACNVSGFQSAECTKAIQIYQP